MINLHHDSFLRLSQNTILAHTHAHALPKGLMRPICAAVDCVWTLLGREDTERERWMACSVVSVCCQCKFAICNGGDHTSVSSTCLSHRKILQPTPLYTLQQAEAQLQTQSTNTVMQYTLEKRISAIHGEDEQSINQEKESKTQSETTCFTHWHTPKLWYCVKTGDSSSNKSNKNACRWSEASDGQLEIEINFYL